MKIIKSEYSVGQQSVNYQEITEGNDELKIQIIIKSDSYDFQNYAIVNVFSPKELKWNLLDSIPFSNMKTPAKLYYQITPDKYQDKEFLKRVMSSKFEEDIKTLRESAEMILGQSFSLVEKKVTHKETVKQAPQEWPFPSSCAPETVTKPKNKR